MLLKIENLQTKTQYNPITKIPKKKDSYKILPKWQESNQFEIRNLNNIF